MRTTMFSNGHRLRTLLRRCLTLVTLTLIPLALSGCFGNVSAIPGSTAYSVSGAVSDTQGQGISDVTIIVTGGINTTTTTDQNGSWSLSGLTGTVTIAAAKDGYTFTPESHQKSGPSNSVNFTGTPDAVDQGTLKVSIVACTEPTDRLRVSMNDLTAIDRSIHKAPFADDSQGNLVGSFTPISVIGCISDLGIAHPNYRMPLSLHMGVATGPSQGFGLLPAYDFLWARDILYADYIVERDRYDFRVVELEVWTRTLIGGRYDDFGAISEVHVDMGDRYSNVIFPNEDADKRYGTTHVFQMTKLIPFQGSTSLVRIAFDDHVDRPYIVNPDGSYVSDFNPYFWDTSTRMGLDAYVIYLPGLDLDFSGGSKHLIFEWDFADLIEVYDNNTPTDLSDDLVTLRLDNPFPITFRVEPYDDFSAVIGNGSVPPDVSSVETRFYDLIDRQVFIRWLNPSVRDYRTTHVVRKEGSAPTSIDDGDIVYEGTFPMLEDDSVELGKDYYYRIVVEDEDGLFSPGIVVNVKTDPPVPARVQVYPESATLEIGQKLRFHVRGETADGTPCPVIGTWQLEGDAGTLNYNQARSVEFTATKEGTATLTVQVGEFTVQIPLGVGCPAPGI